MVEGLSAEHTATKLLKAARCRRVGRAQYHTPTNSTGAPCQQTSTWGLNALTSVCFPLPTPVSVWGFQGSQAVQQTASDKEVSFQPVLSKEQSGKD